MNNEEPITRILKGSAYTPEVVQEVLPLVYEEMKRLAAHFLERERADHTMVATELVHEAYVRLFGLEQVSFENRRHFFATAAMAMRRILVEHQRRRQSGNRIPAKKIDALDDSLEPGGNEPDVDLIVLDRALASLEKLSARQARVIELSYFAGLTEHQIADVLQISRPTVSRDLRAAKLWLRREMRG